MTEEIIPLVVSPFIKEFLQAVFILLLLDQIAQAAPLLLFKGLGNFV